jgi:hypothetical protein
MFFSTIAEKTYLEQKQPVCTVKHLSYRKDSFQNLIRLSQTYNMQECAASNIDGFLRHGANRANVHHETLTLQEKFLSKLKWVHREKQYARCSSF